MDRIVDINELGITKNFEGKLRKAGYESVNCLVELFNNNQDEKLFGIKGIGKKKIESLKSIIIEFDAARKDENDDDEVEEKQEEEKKELTGTLSDQFANLDITFDDEEDTDNSLSIPELSIKIPVTKQNVYWKFLNFVQDILADSSVEKTFCKQSDITSISNVKNIIYDIENKEVYFDAIWAQDQFNRYIINNYDVSRLNPEFGTKRTQNYLKIAMSQLETKDIVFFTKRDDYNSGRCIKYAFNRFRWIGDGKNYIRINIRNLEEYINQTIYVNQSLSAMNIIENNANKVHEDKKIESQNDIKDNEEDVVLTNVVINSCKNIIGSTYLVTFTVIDRIYSNKDEFETSIIVGTYQYSKDDIANGELLISEKYTDNKTYLKDQILKLL